MSFLAFFDFREGIGGSHELIFAVDFTYNHQVRDTRFNPTTLRSDHQIL